MEHAHGARRRNSHAIEREKRPTGVKSQNNCQSRAPVSLPWAAVPRTGAPRGGGAGLPLSVAIGPAGQCPCRIFAQTTPKHMRMQKATGSADFTSGMGFLSWGIRKCRPVPASGLTIYTGCLLKWQEPWGQWAVPNSQAYPCSTQSAGDTKKCTFAIKC